MTTLPTLTAEISHQLTLARAELAKAEAARQAAAGSTPAPEDAARQSLRHESALGDIKAARHLIDVLDGLLRIAGGE